MDARLTFPRLLLLGLLGGVLTLPVAARDVKPATRQKPGHRVSVTLPGKAQAVSLDARLPTEAMAESEDTLISSLDELRSSAVLIQHAETGAVIYQRNAKVRVPIASLTKLMTAVVVLDAHLALDMPVTVEEDDVDQLRHSSSHLMVGTTASREDMLRLALMSSENRAAALLARTYPGGTEAFVARMNRKARSLGMVNTRFVDSSGLGNGNVSTAEDLARLVEAAAHYPLIRQYSTTESYVLNPLSGGRVRQFGNTNPLVRDTQWDIDLSKTGFTNEAGKCLVLKARIDRTPVVMILLDSAGRMTRVGDAIRVRRWLERNPAALHQKVALVKPQAPRS